ncbi:unnamed protein product [Cladocopium goreaui]|uniref:Uncharacterized protein n=1 Tax=Cladocopium goreaui TaxID=2562237 RepID=A0A9P1CFB6_9DINO|nr:unnamed protein product [Cladocopium goreaui]
MDLLQRLDAQVLSRTLSWLPQRQALQLMILASDWVKLVAAHLRRLVIASDLPLGLVTRAAPWCQRLVELQFQACQGDTEKFWATTARCVELLRGAPVKQLGVKGRYVEKCRQDCQDGTLQDAQNLEASPIFKALATHASHWDVETFSVELVPLADVMQPMGCFLEGATGLSSLMLRQCGLTGPGAAPLKFLCETLVSLPFKNLLTLDLSMNALCLEGANFLGEFLQCTPQLQTLLLGGNGLGPAGLAALVRSLSQLPLSTLDLSLNGLGTTGVETLLPAGLQLQSLNLRGNWFGSSHSEIIVHLLQSMSATLVKLDISQNKLGPHGVGEIVRNLPPLPKLRALILAENQFATADFLPEAFGHLSEMAPQLEELDLTANQLGSHRPTVGALCKQLPGSLRALWLGASSLKGENLQAVLQNLDLPLLQRLSLVQAMMDDQSLQLFSGWWVKDPLPQLQFLDISGNFVSGAAIARLKLDLHRNKAFRQLKGRGRTHPLKSYPHHS